MLWPLISYNYDIIYEVILILILFVHETIRFFQVYLLFIIQEDIMKFHEHAFGVVIHHTI